MVWLIDDTAANWEYTGVVDRYNIGSRQIQSSGKVHTAQKGEDVSVPPSPPVPAA